ncbi:MAG TPA: ABC transporter permease, partial [Methanothrix soehngenii]|nr:ABC transporter permease [Methanothrix soehngenii]
MPGDPLTNLLGEDISLTASSVQELRERMGLDRPLSQQFLDYWHDILRFDLGYSFHLHRNVSDLIYDRMKWTLLLSLPAMVMGAILG